MCLPQALNINESRRCYETGRIYVLSRIRAVQVTHCRDAVTANANIPDKPWGARAIHDTGVRDQDVVRGGLS